jgi:GTP-binding protein HflX
VPYPIIALVGYTNAGKSTLFNRLTGAKVMAEDQLFATLDPTMRAITLPSGTKVILSDTVGFVSNLPTQLVAAFRATLEEVLEADIILHVEDASNPAREQQRRDVQDILKDLGLDPEDAESPLIEIWNKSDRLSSEDRAAMKELIVTARQSHDEMKTTPLLISAQTGAGIEALLERLDQTVSEKELELTFTLPAKAGQLVSWLYENSTVQQGETHDDGSTDYTIKLPKSRAGRLEKLLIEAGIQPQNLVNQDGSLNGSLTVTAAE